MALQQALSLVRDENATFMGGVLQSAIANIAALRSMLDSDYSPPSASTEEGAGAAGGLQLQVVTARLDELSVALASEVAAAEEEERRLQERRQQRHRQQEANRQKAAELAALVSSDGTHWKCTACTCENELAARKCAACGTYAPAVAKPKPHLPSPAVEPAKHVRPAKKAGITSTPSRKKGPPGADASGSKVKVKAEGASASAGAAVVSTPTRKRDRAASTMSVGADDMASPLSYSRPRNNLWLGGYSAAADSVSLDASGGAAAESAALVWTCAACTLQNEMRSRTCVVCGESRAHAIRGTPSLFAVQDGPLRTKRAKPSGNPRRFPSVGDSHQVDVMSLPEPVSQEEYMRSHLLLDTGSSSGNNRAPEDCDSNRWTAVWRPPSSSQEVESLFAKDHTEPPPAAKPHAAVDSAPGSSSALPLATAVAAEAREEARGAGSASAKKSGRIASQPRPPRPIPASDFERYLCAYPNNQALALKVLWQSNYDATVAKRAVAVELDAWISESARADTLPSKPTLVHPSWSEEPIVARDLQYNYRHLHQPDHEVWGGALTSAEVDAFAEAVSREGDSWAAVRKLMQAQAPGATCTVRQLQDFWYGAWCSSQYSERRRACDKAYQSRMRAREIQQRKKRLEAQSARRHVEREREKAERQLKGVLEPFAEKEDAEEVAEVDAGEVAEVAAEAREDAHKMAQGEVFELEKR